MFLTSRDTFQPITDFTLLEGFSIVSGYAILAEPLHIEVYPDDKKCLLICDAEGEILSELAISHRLRRFPGMLLQRRLDSEGDPFLYVFPSRWYFPEDYQFSVLIPRGNTYEPA